MKGLLFPRMHFSLSLEHDVQVHSDIIKKNKIKKFADF